MDKFHSKASESSSDKKKETERHLHKDEQVEELKRQRIALMNYKQQKLNKLIYRAAGYEQRFDALLQTASDQESKALDGYQRFGFLFSKNPHKKFAWGPHQDGQSTERTQALEEYKQTLGNIEDIRSGEIKRYEKGMNWLVSQNIDRYDIKQFHAILRFYNEKYTEQMKIIINDDEVSDQDRKALNKQIQASENAASLAKTSIEQMLAEITPHPQGSESPPSRQIPIAPEDVKQAIESFHQKVVDQLDFLMVWHGAGQERSELQAQIGPLQKEWEAISESIDKHPFLRPIREELSDRLEKLDDVSPNESSSNRLLQEHDIKEFFDYFHEVADTLKNANALLVGKNIYANADDRLQDDGKKARDKLLGMSRALKKEIPGKLNRAFEKERLTALRSKHSDLFQHWKISGNEMKIAFGEDMYNRTMQDLTNIAATNYPSKATSLTQGELSLLAKDEERIGAIEAELERKRLYEEYYPEKKGERLPTSLADLPPHERIDGNVFKFIKIREADVWVPKNSFCTADDITQMQEDTTEQFQELQRNLAEEWASIQKDIPILKDFPVEQLWRLCIDEKYQKEDPLSSLKYMNDRGPGDLEPYFLAGVMRTVYFVLKGLEREKLTSNYYRQLHDICADGAVIVQFHGTKTSVDKGYRDIKIGKGAGGDNVVITPNYGLPSGDEGYKWYSEEGFEELCQNYDRRNDGDSRYGNQGHPVGRALLYPPRIMRGLRTLCFNPFTEKECEAHADCIFDQYYKEIDQVHQEIMNKYGQQEWTWDFVKDLSEEEEIEKVLTPIAHCCRELELSHLFWDYNGRLAGFIIPFKLCIENHLVPPIISPDPWVLDFGSSKEIVQEFREGQKRTSQYMSKPEVI